ncbi:MAG: glycosyltransferase, partial [Chitinophagaceae bacterium]
GGFSFEKNHLGLLKIFKKVVKNHPTTHLHLVGDGGLRANVKQKVEEMDLVENITFYGFVNNPLPLIQAADVLVLPSIIEGLPGVLLEAMYCETPVIAYDVGGISEIINANTGSLIPKNDEDSFAEKIMKVLHCASKEQVIKARHLVLESYMNHTLASKFLSTYQNVLNN